jgi:hypothetical protein
MWIRRIAWCLSLVSFAGCALSLLVHAASLAGAEPARMMRFEGPLFLGLFPIVLFAVATQERALSGFGFGFERYRMQSRYVRALLAKYPSWLRKAFYLLMAYVILLFGLFVYRVFPNKAPAPSDEARLLSAYAAVFYLAVALYLFPHAQTEMPVNPVDLPKQ